MVMNEDAILSIARAIRTHVEREAFLDEVCARDENLRGRIESRLVAEKQQGGSRDQPTIAPPEAIEDRDRGQSAHSHPPDIAATDNMPWPDVEAASPEEGLGSLIGRYRLLERLGQGGFGTVYVAEQREPIKRRVALKIVKLGMDTRQVVARFEAERQALAMMDHPNIAKVLDAGATQTGRPYFVMELVRGIPITEYCDVNRLAVESRLKLFMQICHAIQHAHQKGIIHRDIKPSNILITLQDSVPVPKVIDFGIAKATQGELADKTVYTQFRQFIGTPVYMSPEQAEMSGMDIDTRSDIYSLGVLLYELLTGKTPFDVVELVKQSLDEMRRTIRETEAPRPSFQLTRMSDQDLTATAQRLGADKSRLIGMLRGDLDWIVMKAMEKDRTRRYETANGLAVDVQHHLNDEPVLACPPSKLYRFGKLARRNKLTFVAVTSVVAALVLGLMVATVEYVAASRQRDAANLARAAEAQARQNADDNAARADRAAATATRISESLQQLIGSANPDSAKGSNYTVRQLLDDFAAGIGNGLADEPEAEAALQATIGNAYWRLGLGEQGEKHLARALALRRRIFGPRHLKTAETLVEHAWALNEQDRMNEAEAELREALSIYRSNNADPALVIRALEPMVVVLGKQYRWSDVESAVDEALAEARKTPGIEYPEIANMNTGLVTAKLHLGENNEAEKIARDSLAMHLRLQGPEHPETGWGYYCLCNALTTNGKFSEAVSSGENAMDIWMKVYPSNHWSISLGLNAILNALEGAVNNGTLIEVIPTLQKLDPLEAMCRKVDAAMPVQAFGDRVSPSMRRFTGRMRINEIYLALSMELKAAGREQEATECLHRLAALMNSLNHP
jgi:serine/threonine protein kinase/tetratricopeptide (TPR) repeat protein